jgi:hypothetical protein
MIVREIICDRCGAKIEDEAHPPLLVTRTWKKSDKITVQSGYRDDAKIHFCKSCNDAFISFMQKCGAKMKGE